MSTLTDRYVWGVLRAVPQGQRAELEPEVRALVADAIEARTVDGLDAAAAERAALTELGNPELLAARYTGRSLVLIGPAFYPDWKRLLAVLLPIVVPITAIAVAAAGYVDGRPLGEVILGGLNTAFMVGVQLTFWITLVFAFLERTGQPPVGKAWTPDALPDLPGKGTVNPLEVVVASVALLVAIGALVWQQVAMPITIEGESYPLFDPALWSFWLPWFIAVLAVEIVFTFVRWARGGWSWGLAVANLVLNVAFAVPAVYLLQNGMLLDPGLVDAVESMAGTAWVQPTVAAFTVLIVLVAAWDTVDGFLQAYRASGRPAAAA